MSNGLFPAEVIGTRHVTPLMIRVTLGLDGYVSSGAADEYFKMFFPAEGQREPVLPEVVEGRWVYPEGVPEPVLRTYTVRRFTPGTGEMDVDTMDVDFVVHEGGVAAPWAMRARPGDRVGVSAAHGLHRPPREASWQLIVGDATALPAIGRIVEELPAGTSATVYAQVAGPAERQEFDTRGQVDITWLYPGDIGLPEVVRRHDVRDAYVWAAGEAAAMRAIRKYLRHDLRLPADRFATLGYWRPAAEEWQRRFEQVAPDVRARVAVTRERGGDTEQCQDEFDAALEAAGL
ncbi:siderophore-interacting protein [Nonomuraea sp. NPDC050540]|uniref:siderophore-interacting protein n=1 Tax=Nonomuraea sp. NPDC050540 TaxID=3364367 RepID=UPI0037A37EA0